MATSTTATSTYPFDGVLIAGAPIVVTIGQQSTIQETTFRSTVSCQGEDYINSQNRGKYNTTSSIVLYNIG